MHGTTVKNAHSPSPKEPFSNSDYNESLIFLPGVRDTKIPNFMKIRPMVTDLFHAGRQTDRHDEANSRFSQFCESP